MEEAEFKSVRPNVVTKWPFYDRQTLERKVKRLLADEPEATVIHLFWYHVFARQVSARLRPARSEAERVEAAAAVVAHWKKQGLPERVMIRILGEIFLVHGSLNVVPGEHDSESTSPLETGNRCQSVKIGG